MKRAIKTRYPVTANKLRAKISLLRGSAFEAWWRHNRPDYHSPGGRVCRWSAAALEKAHTVFGISGRTFQTLKVEIILPRTNLWRFRATGSEAQMCELLALAFRHWQDLPGGQEVETLAARMFPEAIQLEPTRRNLSALWPAHYCPPLRLRRPAAALLRPPLPSGRHAAAEAQGRAQRMLHRYAKARRAALRKLAAL